MIRQQFFVEHYWKVIVYLNVDYNFFDNIVKELEDNELDLDDIKEIYKNMSTRKAKAVTCSNTKLHTSIVLFNKHNSFIDYLNSVVHEAEHIKQAMLKAYHIEDRGEAPAYTIGYLVGRMYITLKRIII